MTGAVLLEISGHVAHVTLSNPGKLNAMSRGMWRQLQDAFVQVQGQLQVRGVLVKGESGHFCAGGDISEYATFRFAENSLRDFHENEVWGGLQAMLDCDVPIVAQMDGNCMGAGVEIASCCDLRLAGDDARFGAPIARLGFPMAPRELALVTRVAGESTVREMLLAAVVFDAAEMKRRGFVHQVVPAADLAQTAARQLERITALAPQAARLNKQALRVLAAPADAASSLATLVAGAYRYADSAEHREGVQAFVEKRPPVFAS